MPPPCAVTSPDPAMEACHPQLRSRCRGIPEPPCAVCGHPGHVLGLASESPVTPRRMEGQKEGRFKVGAEPGSCPALAGPWVPAMGTPRHTSIRGPAHSVASPNPSGAPLLPPPPKECEAAGRAGHSAGPPAQGLQTCQLGAGARARAVALCLSPHQPRGPSEVTQLPLLCVARLRQPQDTSGDAG